METKNRTLATELTTSDSTLYTVPNNYEAEIQSIVISNNAGAKRQFTLEWFDSSSSAYFALADDIDIEARSIVQVTQPLWLLQNESLRGSASVDNSVVITTYVKEHYIPKQF